MDEELTKQAQVAVDAVRVAMQEIEKLEALDRYLEYDLWHALRGIRIRLTIGYGLAAS